MPEAQTEVFWSAMLPSNAGSLTSASEAKSTSSNSPRQTAATAAPVKKPRSCVLCKSRKVRCDRLSPCSNCRRANLACVVPSIDQTPRWARRLKNKTNKVATGVQDSSPAARVIERLRNLEGLANQLSSQLEQANTSTQSTNSLSSATSPASSNQKSDTDQHGKIQSGITDGNIQNQPGNLVFHDASQSQYVGSGFWSRVNDELTALKMDTQILAQHESDTSDDEEFLEKSGKSPSTQEMDRPPSDRHAFIFGNNLKSPVLNLRDFHPLPSQIPFLLEVFSGNVNLFAQVVHMPTVTKMVHNWRDSNRTNLSPANEALMFSIYYAAITSMEEDDIMTNFGSTKSELNLKYRVGLEYALAKADFLNTSDMVLVQAVAIFLCLARRHDSPRFVWIMTGLLVRMAQALGLHRDGARLDARLGSRLQQLTPFECEIRRRVWWLLCMLDVRASEDQGTDLIITTGSFDTKFPLNINDNDFGPDTQEMPPARVGLTDMSLALVWAEMFDTTRRMVSPGIKDGASQENSHFLLNQLSEKMDRQYLQYVGTEKSIVNSVGVLIIRVVIAKMTLVAHLPILFSSHSDQFSEELRTKLLVSAIEVAEYNHTLNTEHAYRHWRWIFQTYTHWHSIIYILIEICRRPWSPLVERAWVALHSNWLIPTQTTLDKNLPVWVSLRKLIAKARKHRQSELERLRGDSHAADLLEVEFFRWPIPTSSGLLFTSGSDAEDFLERWRQLVRMAEISEDSGSTPSVGPTSKLYSHSIQAGVAGASTQSSVPVHGEMSSGNEPFWPPVSGVTAASILPDLQSDSITGQSSGTVPTASTGLPGTHSESHGFPDWLWNDDAAADDSFNMDSANLDINMDLDEDMDWYDWIDSAKGMELNLRSNGSAI